MKIVAEKFPNLYPFMFNIIKIDSNQRMSSGEGWAAMRPYSEKITELQPFYRNTTAENNSIKKFRGEKWWFLKNCNDKLILISTVNLFYKMNRWVI